MGFEYKSPSRAIIVSGADKSGVTLTSLLDKTQYEVVAQVKSGSEARRLLGLHAFDLAIVNSPLTDESGVDLALDLVHNDECGVLLIIKAERFSEVSYKVEPYGVFTVQKPISAELFFQALHLLYASEARRKRLLQKAKSLMSKLDDLKVISRAKLLLIENLKMSEEDAHRFIEKQAMDMRTTREEIASRILSTYEN